MKTSGFDNAPIRVRIVGKHPWTGETGQVPVQDGKVTYKTVLGREFVEIDLDNGCRCAAERKNIQILKE